jgi:hypothetical protein
LQSYQVDLMKKRARNACGVNLTLTLLLLDRFAM